MAGLPLNETKCQLCKKFVWIIEAVGPARFKADCVRDDCPVTADCRAAGSEPKDGVPFTYQILFAEPEW